MHSQPSLAPAGALLNLSSYEPLKKVIMDHGLQTLTHEIIVPHSGWEHDPNEESKPRDAAWTTVFKNTSGSLRSGQCQPRPCPPPWVPAVLPGYAWGVLSVVRNSLGHLCPFQFIQEAAISLGAVLRCAKVHFGKEHKPSKQARAGGG